MVHIIGEKKEPGGIYPWYHRPDTMCIGLAGSAGVGKTTLMNEVNKYLEYPAVQEGVREWMKEKKIEDVHKLTGDALMKFQLETLNRKIAAEEGRQKFISDRTSIDIMCYALYYLSNEEKYQRGLMDYVNNATVHAAKTYDVIFTLPYGAIPFENDGVRKDMPAHQLTIHMLIEHACALGLQIYNVHQIQAVDLEERVVEMLGVIEKMKKIKADVEASKKNPGDSK